MTDILLRIEDLYQCFRDKTVLDDIDLKVSKGEFVTLVGPSGSGKSTLLRIILGQDFPKSGEVLLNGISMGVPSRDRGIVYQHYSLFPHLTVLQNVMLGFNLGLNWWNIIERRKSKKEKLELAHEFLNEAGMFDHVDRYPHQLSGGQRQRVAIVQAVITRPKILLMDEPFSALDPQTRESMQMFVQQQWKDHGMTIFFVTHDLPEAVYLGTRILAISQYYTDDRCMDASKGAKIVYDRLLRDQDVVLSPDVKMTPEFNRIIEDVRQHAFDPQYLQHVREFNLDHPDSFVTHAEGVCLNKE